MSLLHSPYALRGTTFRNRAWVAPMCQYSAVDGVPQDWHFVHLGSLAVGGAGLVITEATAVTPEGRISPWDVGIWNDEQQSAWTRIAGFIAEQGAVPGIQLAHAGRKASTQKPWEGRDYVEPADGGWQTVGPSPIAYDEWPAPKELSIAEIASVVQAFGAAAGRASAAGFQVAELHAAHGYLLHQFLSPLSNQRADEYGGDLAGRSRIVVEVLDAVRAAWPADRPVFVRLSATDWAEGGWDVEETVALAKILSEHGADLIDVSSGGLAPQQQISAGPGFQVPFARQVRSGASVATAAVGLITEPEQAEQILADGSADAVLFARELLRDPHWPLRAGLELGDDVSWPPQYERAKPR